MELIKDVANELDIDVLCHKILVNVGLLTHADRGSLFLVKGNTAQNRCLVAKLFDVTQSTGEFLRFNAVAGWAVRSSRSLAARQEEYGEKIARRMLS